MTKKYCVYEHATNVIWSVMPPTKENAKKQVFMLNLPGHTAMSVKRARALQAAFRAGMAADQDYST